MKRKDTLLTELHQYADAFGLAHPRTVAKSQELDVIVNKIVFFDINQQKKAS
jgi:hypothetical protein